MWVISDAIQDKGTQCYAGTSLNAIHLVFGGFYLPPLWLVCFGFQ